MLPSQVPAQDIENARVILVLLAAGIIVFWRYLLRIVLAVMAVAVGVGAVVILQSMHHLPAARMPVGGLIGSPGLPAGSIKDGSMAVTRASKDGD